MLYLADNVFGNGVCGNNEWLVFFLVDPVYENIDAPIEWFDLRKDDENNTTQNLDLYWGRRFSCHSKGL